MAPKDTPDKKRRPLLKNIGTLLVGLACLAYFAGLFFGGGLLLKWIDGRTGLHIASLGNRAWVWVFGGPDIIVRGSGKPGVLHHTWTLINDSEKDGGNLSDVSVALTFVSENGEPVEVKATWNSWNKSESKELVVPPGRYKRVDIETKAKLNGTEKSASGSWDCRPGDWDVLPDQEGYEIPGDVVWYHLKFKNTVAAGSGDLTDVAVIALCQPPSGAPAEFKESWGDWKKGETKRIAIRASEYKAVKLKGTAKLDGKDFLIDVDWPQWSLAAPQIRDVGTALTGDGETLQLTNKIRERALQDVELSVELRRNDGIKTSFEVSWPSWEAGEMKAMKVPPNKYASCSIKGRASVDGTEVKISATSTWDWH